MGRYTHMPTRVLLLGQASRATRRSFDELPTTLDCELTFETSDLASARATLCGGRADVAIVCADFAGAVPGAGFAMIASLPVELRPLALVIVSEREEDAVRAFELEATDFLTDPVDRDRLHGAMLRARQGVLRAAMLRKAEELQRLILEASGAGIAPMTSSERTAVPRGAPRTVLVREGRRTRFVPLADIDWFEADGNYIVVHAGGEQFRTRGTIASIEAGLDPRQFARIHRRIVVNMDRVRELSPLPGGDAIGREVVAKIGRSPAILMRQHGVFTIGPTIAKALQAAIMVEDVAHTVAVAMGIGEISVLPEEEIQANYDRYHNRYGTIEASLGVSLGTTASGS